MAQKQKVSTVKSPTAQVQNTGCDWGKYTLPMRVLLTVSFLLLLYCTLNNIKYPLFWADESMTMVGAQRVLEFGYPKVHDGKNIWYDLRHTDMQLGIDSETDAYVGGTGWLHYYFGAAVEWMVSGQEDMYIKTGLIRTFFAIMAILGILMLTASLIPLFRYAAQGQLLVALVLVISIGSVSLYLHMKEARYYALSIFLQGAIVALVSNVHRFSGVARWGVSALLATILFLTFHCFAPQFFINIVAIGIFSIFYTIGNFSKEKSWTQVVWPSAPYFLGLVLALLFVLPQLSYFKTFEISEAMAQYNGYSSKMYKENLKTIWKFFTTFEPGYAVLLSYIFLLFNVKKIKTYNADLLRVSIFLFIFSLLYIVLIARIPNFIYTRYIVVLIPIGLLAIVLNSVLIVFANSNANKVLSYILVSLIALSWIGNLWSNKKYIASRFEEQASIYKGPLDYTIPFIKEKYVKTDTLVIAANYEETSYVYYLGSKVVVGFVGNNLEEDAKATPHVLAFRKPWGNYIELFQGYMQKNAYQRQAFEVYDNPVNNIPELNFMPAFNHKFNATGLPVEQMPTELFYR